MPMSPKTMPIAPIDELVQRPLGVAVRSLVRRLGFGASGRGDAHVMKFKPDRLRTRIPIAARAACYGRRAD